MCIEAVSAGTNQHTKISVDAKYVGIQNYNAKIFANVTDRVTDKAIANKPVAMKLSDGKSYVKYSNKKGIFYLQQLILN